MAAFLITTLVMCGALIALRLFAIGFMAGGKALPGQTIGWNLVSLIVLACYAAWAIWLLVKVW